MIHQSKHPHHQSETSSLNKPSPTTTTTSPSSPTSKAARKRVRSSPKCMRLHKSSHLSSKSSVGGRSKSHYSIITRKRKEQKKNKKKEEPMYVATKVRYKSVDDASSLMKKKKKIKKKKNLSLNSKKMIMKKIVSSPKNLSKKTKQVTVASTEKERSLDKFVIKVRFGTDVQNISITPPFGLFSTKLYKVFNWSKTQNAGIVIIGLKDAKGNFKSFSRYEDMANEEYLRYNCRIDKHHFFLHPNAAYELVIQDMREHAVISLDSLERKEIREEYNKMDGNGNGFIEMDEIKKYQEKLYNRKVEKWNQWLNDKCRDRPDMKRAFAIIKTEAIERDFSLMNRNIKYYTEQDVNRDGKIEWNEFLRSEAILRLNKGSKSIKRKKNVIKNKELKTKVRAKERRKRILNRYLQ